MSVLWSAVRRAVAGMRERRARESPSDPVQREVLRQDPVNDYMMRITEGLFPNDAKNLRRVVQDGPPPDLDNFEHKLAVVPVGAKLKAWAKLQETERRLAVAIWAMWRTEPESGKHRVLAEDLVGSFFHSFEATVQVLKEEMVSRKGKGWFDPWILAHANSTVTLRGIRTVRTLAVHVEDIRSDSAVVISIVKGRGGTLMRQWRLPTLTAANLGALNTPKLKEADLAAWEELRGKWAAGTLMENALKDLRSIVFDAERVALSP